MELFNDDFKAPATPGQELRAAHKRRVDRDRQRRHRARQKMTPAQVAANKLETLRQHIEAQAAQLQLDAAPDRDIFAALRHEWFFMRAIFLGGPIGARIFECVTPDDFTQSTHALIFGAAQKLHARGVTVTAGGIRAQLKSDGIIPLFKVDDFEKAATRLKRDIGLDDIDAHTRDLKQA